MSTRERKARKRAGIRFEKAAKVPTEPRPRKERFDYIPDMRLWGVVLDAAREYWVRSRGRRS